MVIYAGSTVYVCGEPPCTGVGVVWTAEEMNSAMAEVKSILYDVDGRSSIANALEVLATDFKHRSVVKRIAFDDRRITNGSVGEAVAHAYLAEHHDCRFPWPSARDKRVSRASLPGPDLIGFCNDGNGTCFVFGEVKTSTDRKHPPSSVYGYRGLIRQMLNLRDVQDMRDDAVRYLWHHISGQWHEHMDEALRRYMNDSSDVRLYGVLVRDVAPSKSDLRSPVEKLAKGNSAGVHTRFLALHMPVGSIRTGMWTIPIPEDIR